MPQQSFTVNGQRCSLLDPLVDLVDAPSTMICLPCRSGRWFVDGNVFYHESVTPAFNSNDSVDGSVTVETGRVMMVDHSMLSLVHKMNPPHPWPLAAYIDTGGDAVIPVRGFKHRGQFVLFKLLWTFFEPIEDLAKHRSSRNKNRPRS